MSSTANSNKGRRVTIDLTSAASAEVDRLREITGLSTANIFRSALALFRDCVDATREGKRIRLVDENGDAPDAYLTLPVIVGRKQTEQSGERT